MKGNLLVVYRAVRKIDITNRARMATVSARLSRTTQSQNLPAKCGFQSNHPPNHLNRGSITIIRNYNYLHTHLSLSHSSLILAC